MTSAQKWFERWGERMGAQHGGGKWDGKKKRKHLLNTSEWKGRYSWLDKTVACPASLNLHPLSQNNYNLSRSFHSANCKYFESINPVLDWCFMSCYAIWIVSLMIWGQQNILQILSCQMSMCKNCPQGFQWRKSLHTNKINMRPQPPGNTIHSLLSFPEHIIHFSNTAFSAACWSLLGFPCPVVL